MHSQHNSQQIIQACEQSEHILGACSCCVHAEAHLPYSRADHNREGRCSKQKGWKRYAAQAQSWSPVGSNVAPSRTKRLGEGAHHDINICRVHPCVLADAASSLAQSANAVCLIQVQICLRRRRQLLGTAGKGSRYCVAAVVWQAQDCRVDTVADKARKCCKQAQHCRHPMCSIQKPLFRSITLPRLPCLALQFSPLGGGS